MRVSRDGGLVLFTPGDNVPGVLIGDVFQAKRVSGIQCHGCALRRSSCGGPQPDARACSVMWYSVGCKSSWRAAT